MDPLEAWLADAVDNPSRRATVRACIDSLDDFLAVELVDLEETFGLKEWPSQSRRRFVTAWIEAQAARQVAAAEAQAKAEAARAKAEAEARAKAEAARAKAEAEKRELEARVAELEREVAAAKMKWERQQVYSPRRVWGPPTAGFSSDEDESADNAGIVGNVTVVEPTCSCCNEEDCMCRPREDGAADDGEDSS